MAHRLKLNSNGVLVPHRMHAFTPSAAQRVPSVKVSRLVTLLKTHEPRICIVRGEGIGDVLMTTPAVHAIKQLFGKVNLTYATNTRYLEGSLVKVLQYNPDIDRIIDRDNLDEQDYDLTINLHCPCIHYERKENPPVNRIDLFAKHIGLTLTDFRPRYYLRPSEIEKGQDLLARVYNEKVILVQPSASNNRRSLPHSTLKHALMVLWETHHIHSIILTHSTDYQTDILWNNIPGSIPLPNASIRDIAGVIVHCDLVLCQDSSVLHLAGALGCPTVALFGPTDPRARVNHYPATKAISRADGAPCHCWYNACPIGEICWKNITPGLIVEECLKHLATTTRINLKALPLADKDRIGSEII